MRRFLTPTEKQHLRAAHRAGTPASAAAKEIGCNKRTAQQWYAAFEGRPRTVAMNTADQPHRGKRICCLAGCYRPVSPARRVCSVHAKVPEMRGSIRFR